MKNIFSGKNYLKKTYSLSLLVALYFLVAFNVPIVELIAKKHGLTTAIDYIFMVSVVVFLFTIINFILSLFSFRYLFKPWLIFLLLSSSSASYFMANYHILLDSSMFQNIMETDVQETRDLISQGMIFYITFLGIFPSMLVVFIPVQYQSFGKEILYKTGTMLGTVASIGLIAFVFYQDYASLFRNNAHLRDQIIPLNYLYSGYAYAHTSFFGAPEELIPVGADAHLGKDWDTPGKKVITIIVVGETARADNFSLNGYARNTNPYLKKQNIIYLNNVSSCGTATAVSVPCMFSILNRQNYNDSKAKHSENLLDTIHHTGLPVLWRDNNSSCKGVCARTDYDDVSHLLSKTLCNEQECFDPVLLDNLKNKIDSYGSTNGLVIVLHQKGSHGPAYYARVPEAFKTYTPTCDTNQIQGCSQQQIVNSYDNTIAYTDYTLSLIIDFLKKYEGDYDSSLIYMSDHGESLGEHSIYLHGLPYSIAPKEQTHIPALLWLSDGFAKRFGINTICLSQKANQAYSHDNLFHSVLGLLDIKTTAYNPALDIFRPCKQ